MTITQRVETCLRQATRTFETATDEFTRIQAHAAMDAYKNVLKMIQKTDDAARAQVNSLSFGILQEDGYKYATGITAKWAVGESKHHHRIILAEKAQTDPRYKVLKELTFSSLDEAEAKAAELDAARQQEGK